MRDTDFKKIVFICKDKKNNNYPLRYFYNPDVVFTLGNKKMVIIEHSSTGDRKVHIGELLQAYQYAVESGNKCTFILVLDGKNETSPTVDAERERLSFYYEFLKKLTNKDLMQVYVFDMKDIKKIMNNENVINCNKLKKLLGNYSAKLLLSNGASIEK